MIVCKGQRVKRAELHAFPAAGAKVRINLGDFDRNSFFPRLLGLKKQMAVGFFHVAV